MKTALPTDGALRQATERAIANADRANDGMPEYAYGTLMFRLAQYLLAVPGATDTGADDLQPYALAYWSACQHLFGSDRSWDIVWLEFCDLWDHQKVKWPKGDCLARAAEVARHEPCPPELLRYADTRVRLLGKVCRALARNFGDHSRFFLSSIDAGRICGINRREVSRLLHGFCRDGLMMPIERPLGNHYRTHWYRWLGNLA